MGLLDRNKARAPAAGAASTIAPPQVTAPLAPAAPPDPQSLRDMLIAAVAARDTKLVSALATTNRALIAENFAEWQKVPQAIRENGSAMQRYAAALIMIAEIFRDQFGDVSLIQRLSGPPADPATAQWERTLAQAEALTRELKFDEAEALLTQALASLENVPSDGPAPLHAVTEGRLAHCQFSKGDAESAIAHMRRALQFSEDRNDDAGIMAALRGVYEIERYLGHVAEAADFAQKLAERLERAGNLGEAAWWKRQGERVRAGEPLCRVVFFVNDQQVEPSDVTGVSDGRLRYGFVRNRPAVALCEALTQRGMQTAAQAKFDEAVTLFNQAARVDRFDPSPHYQAAVTLMHQQKVDAALAEYDATEQLAPGWFNSRAERTIAAQIGEGKLAPQVFFILRTEEMPDQSATWDQKLNLVEQAIGQSGELPALLLYKSRCLMRLGRLPEAEPVLRSALEKVEEPDLKTRILVDLQMVSPDPAEKRMLLQEAVALNGNLAAAAVAQVALRQMIV